MARRARLAVARTLLEASTPHWDGLETRRAKRTHLRGLAATTVGGTPSEKSSNTPDRPSTTLLAIERTLFMEDTKHIQHEVTSYESLYRLSLREAREQLLATFERAYLKHLLERAHGNVAAAARLAGVDRGTLFRLLKRLGLRVERRGLASDTPEAPGR